MINQLFRLGFLAFLWKRYKAAIVSMLVLFIFLWLIGTLHQDCISYAQINDDTENVALSFLLKWLLYIAAIISFLYGNFRHYKNIQIDDLPPVSKNTDSNSSHSDPFENIRQKEKLSSRADRIIEKTPEK